MSIWIAIVHHNKNVIGDKTTIKTTFVPQNIEATSFSLDFFLMAEHNTKHCRFIMGDLHQYMDLLQLLSH